MNDNQDEKFMMLANEEAEKSMEPLKCGAIIVKDGEIIAKAHNSQRASNNASAHAEIKAIGIAGQIVGSKNLNGCDIYCTCEPCTMCLSAISFAKIKKLFFRTSLSDVYPVDRRIDITKDEFMKKTPHKFEVIKM
jgi:tRNA(Arg) A34 adenosine deaminase TadA